jgi:nicotinamidase-related amidase
MELSRKIQELDSCYSMKLSSLQVDRKYPITHAERIGTRFGPAVVVAIRDAPDRILKVLMPRRFYSAFTDQDFEDINSANVMLYLVFKGQCVNTHAFKVTIENQ